jgi:drug/metabolite transporter (DMT)-like permease
MKHGSQQPAAERGSTGSATGRGSTEVATGRGSTGLTTGRGSMRTTADHGSTRITADRGSSRLIDDHADRAITLRRAWLAWIAVCIIWGTTYLGIRISLETMPPALMAGLRWTLAGMLVLGVIRAQGVALPPLRRWPDLSLLAVLMIGFGNGWVVWAEQHVPSGVAAVIVATSPFWMVSVEACMPGGERLRAGTIIGLLIGFAGILLLAWPDLSVGGSHAWRFAAGLGALQLACAGWAFGSSYSKRRRGNDHVVASTGVQMLLGGILMLLVGTVAGEWPSLHFSGRTASALVYLVVVGSVMGFVAYIYALKHLPVSTVSLYAYVNPVIAVLLGAVVLGEPLNARVATAATIVLAGLAVVRVTTSAVARQGRVGNAPEVDRMKETA